MAKDGGPRPQTSVALEKKRIMYQPKFITVLSTLVKIKTSTPIY